MVQVSTNLEKAYPRDHLKAWVEDVLTGVNTPLFFHQAVPTNSSLQGNSQLPIKKILGHRLINGKLHFHTLWHGTEEDTWEPVSNFVDGICEPWLQYCKSKRLDVTLSGL